MTQEYSFRKIKAILIIVLAINWAVSAAKVLLGLATKSASIMADGFHSLSDGLSNVVGIIGVTMAARPKDRDHPYGHGKMENFAAIGIALLLFLLCIEIAENAIRRLVTPVLPRLNAASFIIMVLTAIINCCVMSYEHKKGKELKSDILVADSYHTRTDIYVSMAVIASMLGAVMRSHLLDVLVSLSIAVLIAKMGLEILRGTSKVLCDKAVIPPEKIREVVMRIRGVRECHAVRTRGREDQIMVDLSVHVDDAMHVADAHEISGGIESAIKAAFQGVHEVIVHIEPEGE